MNKLITTLLLVVAALFMVPSTALAQLDAAPEVAEAADAAPEPAPAPVAEAPAPAAENPAKEDPGGVAQGVYDALKNGHYLMAFGGVLMFLVWLLRWGAVKLSSWFESKLGGFVLAFATSFALTLGEAFWAGHGFSLVLFGGALSAAWMAAGQWGHLKDVLKK